MNKEKKEIKKEDKYIFQNDNSTTRIARATDCCGGYHQTIAGALLNSEYWKDWYEHASKNMLFDVDETLTIDAMSDEHFRSFMKFCLDSYANKKLEKVKEKIKILERNGKWKGINAAQEDEEYNKALDDILSILNNK